MLVLITYDVSTSSLGGQRRLRKVAKACVDYGQRVQNSVFECSLDQSQFLLLRDRLLSIVDEKEDSIRFYNLGNRYRNRIEHYGVADGYEPDGLLMV